ncbi:MAG: heavy-metal-associated domain-containing protein [Thermoleophilia bacterium]
MPDLLVFSVPAVRCGSCRTAIAQELSGVAAVESFDVDLDARTVSVRATAGHDAAIRAAIERAGYEVGP